MGNTYCRLHKQMKDTAASPPAPLAAPAFNPWTAVSILGLAVMEAAWVTLLYQSVNLHTASDAPALVLFVFLLAALAARLLGHLFLTSRVSRNRVRGGLLIAYAALFLAANSLLLRNAPAVAGGALDTALDGMAGLRAIIPGGVFLAGALLWLLLRGVTQARQGAGTFVVQANLRLGMGMFLLYSLLALAADSELPGLAFFVLFLSSALLAMAAARVALLGRLRGGRRNPFSRAWLGSVAAAVAATVGAGFSLALLATGRFIVFYQRLVVAAFTAFVGLTLAPFLLILSLFGNVYTGPAEVPAEGSQLPPGEEDLGGAPNLLDELPSVERLPAEARAAYYAVAVTLAVIIVGGIFWGARAVYLRYRGEQAVEYVIRPGDWLAQFRRAGAPPDQAAQARRRLAERQRALAAARIRQIYAALMDVGEAMGAPRAAAQTPLEFLATLQARLHPVQAELAQVTHAYLKVRYGELPETHAEVDAVERAWRKVQAQGGAAARVYQAQRKEEERAQRRREWAA
jgi:hypothetical protein